MRQKYTLKMNFLTQQASFYLFLFIRFPDFPIYSLFLSAFTRFSLGRIHISIFSDFSEKHILL